MKDHKNIPLIIGIGNAMRGDDGFGIEVLSRLLEEQPYLGEYVFVEEDLSNLIQLWHNRPVTIVDLVYDPGQAPGQLFTAYSADELLQHRQELMTSHGVGICDALALSKSLQTTPSSLFFVGVTGHDFTLSNHLSEEVEKMIPKVMQFIKASLEPLNHE